MTISKDDDIIVDYFKAKNSFTKCDIKDLLKEKGFDITDNALRQRIYRLKQKSILQTVKRGVYKISDKPIYRIEENSFIKNISKLFLQKYDGLNYCIWNTHWLNNFMVHQPVNFFYVFEVDKDVLESVFYYFKDENIKVFNNPTEQIMEEYVLGDEDVVIVKPFISRSPITKQNKTSFAKLEKIVVDIFCDTHQFYVYSGQEMINIFQNIFDHYNINIGKIYNYALRRGKKKQIESFIHKNIETTE